MKKQNALRNETVTWINERGNLITETVVYTRA